MAADSLVNFLFLFCFVLFFHDTQYLSNICAQGFDCCYSKKTIFSYWFFNTFQYIQDNFNEIHFI